MIKHLLFFLILLALKAFKSEYEYEYEKEYEKKQKLFRGIY